MVYDGLKVDTTKKDPCGAEAAFRVLGADAT